MASFDQRLSRLEERLAPRELRMAWFDEEPVDPKTWSTERLDAVIGAYENRALRAVYEGRGRARYCRILGIGPGDPAVPSGA